MATPVSITSPAEVIKTAEVPKYNVNRVFEMLSVAPAGYLVLQLASLCQMQVDSTVVFYLRLVPTVVVALFGVVAALLIARGIDAVKNSRPLSGAAIYSIIAGWNLACVIAAVAISWFIKEMLVGL